MQVKQLLLVVLGIVILESTSHAQTILSGYYGIEKTLYLEESPYLVVDSAVFDGPSLTIERGVIITFKYHPDPEKKSYVRITGELILQEWVGAPPPPVIFTSERDNAPFDLNGDLTASRPAPGDWGYVHFDPKNPPVYSYPPEYSYMMDSLLIRYGGGRMFKNEKDPGLYPMTVINDYNEPSEDYLRLTFHNSHFTHSAGVGVLAGMANFNGCEVKYNHHGIRMLSSDTYILNSDISHNKLYPVYLIDPVIKRDGGEDFNMVIESFHENYFNGNAVDAIALEGTLSCAYDLNSDSRRSDLSNFNLPYLICGDLFIDSIDLYIHPGSLIKFLPEAYTGKPLNIIMKNTATLNVFGPVVFTSLHDHQHDFTTPDDIRIKPVPGDWGFISGPMPVMSGVQFKYGGKYFSPSQQQVIPDSCAVLHITGARPRQLDILGGNRNGTVSQCVFHKLYAHGVLVTGLDPQDPEISILNNTFALAQERYGIQTPAAIDPLAKMVDAQNNYWNGKLGPFHPELNPGGNGCLVGDHVNFAEFQSSSPHALLMSSSIIRGMVTNKQGSPVEKALVKLRSKQARSTYTDRDGLFYLSSVKPGEGYQLEIMAKAHRDTLIAPLNVPADTSLLFSLALKEYTIDYAIDNFAFNINPEESHVSLGGSAHRYYRIVDINTKEPVYGVEVLVPGLDTFYTNSKGIVDIAIPSEKVGGPFQSKSFSIQRVGIETLDFPYDESEVFTVGVLPYSYNKIWSGSTYFKVGVFGFEASKERGAALDLFVKNEGQGEYADSIRMSRQSRTGFGYNLGASAKIEAGPLEAGAEAGVGVNLNAIFEDDFKFDYPNSTGTLAVAKFIVLADGALPYMDAPLIRYFVSCLEKQVDEIEAAALTNGIGMNLHAQASAEAGIDLNLLEGDQGSLGAELSGSASATGDITFMTRLYAHKDPLSNEYPLDLDFNYTGEIELGVNASIGFNLGKLFGDGENENKGSEDETKVETDSNLPFQVPDEDFGFDLASANASGGIKYGLHFGTTRFLKNPSCRLGFMYGYKYDLSAEAILLGGTGISENREISYTFNFSDQYMVDMVKGKADLAKSMLTPSELIKLDLSDLTSGKIFNGSLNSIAYQQTRNAFSLAPVPYQKTISDQVDEGGFNLNIDIGIAVVRAKFGAGFNYAEHNNYTKENGVFYNWELFPLESYDYLSENEDFSAGPILQDILSKSASYLVDEVKRKLIPPIFRKIKIWPFRRKAGQILIPIGPDTRSSYMYFADSSSVGNIEGIDSLDVIYWDWYGTGEDAATAKATKNPAMMEVYEYVKKSARQIHKLDYGIGGFYQFEPYNTSVGDEEVFVEIGYFNEELEVMLSDSSLHYIDERKLRMYKEDKENNRWIFIGGVVDTVSNSVRARIDAFGTFTLAPFIPAGPLELTAFPDTIQLDSTNTSTISSNTIFYNTEAKIATGELFTLKSSRGSFQGSDADPSREGFQVAASGGSFQAIYESNDLSGSVTILAESVMGDAKGSIELFVSDSQPPATPVLSGIEMQEEEVLLWWQKGSDPDLMRYLVHYDTIPGGPYQGEASVFGDPSPLDAGLDSLLLISGLTPGKTYYFAISAVDRCGNISDYSNELSVLTLVNHQPVFYHRVIHIKPDLSNGTIVDTLMARDEDKDQQLRFFFSQNNSEDAFALDPVSGILSVQKEERLNYFVTRTDTFLLHIGVIDDALIPSSDEGLVMVILDVDTWVPQYPESKATELELYPNPARDQVSVKLGETALRGQVSLSIFGTDGKCHYRTQYQGLNEASITLPTGHLKDGVYHVLLETEKEKRSGKLVIMK